MSTQMPTGDRVARAPSPWAGWRLVAAREINDLWTSGKAFFLLILFSVVLGVLTFLLASNSELRVIPPKEMVFLTLQVTVAAGLFVSLILGADSLSGERDRATLEGLLLTPVSRRQIVVGKFIAAVSTWPAILVVSSAYLAMLSPDRATLSEVLLWGALLGSLLVAAITAFGMLVSLWSSSNMNSLFASLGFSMILVIPTQFPATAQAGAVGQLIQRLNPLEATNQFLAQTLVSNRTPGEMGSWLAAPLVFAALVLGLLFWYASPGLRLEPGRANVRRPQRGRGVALSLICAAYLMGPFNRQTVVAQQVEQSTAVPTHLEISIDRAYEVVPTGDAVEFSTLITYHGPQVSPPTIVAMNIVNLADEGDPVDPEDWSPQRSQYIEQLAPGQSVNLTWTIRALLQGDYAAYMVAMPEPDGPNATSQPVASSALHLTVTPYVRLNPGGVVPLALGMPLALTLGMSFLRRRRRREIDSGETR